MQAIEQNERFTPNFGAARLSRANLEGANLSSAKAQFVDFREANLKRATAVGAFLQGADLSGANLQYADFSGAELKAATMFRCNLCGTKLAQAHGITQEHLDSAFGDGSTTIPAKLKFPDHWPKIHLDELDAQLNWRKWQADPENYVPPVAPEEA